MADIGKEIIFDPPERMRAYHFPTGRMVLLDVHSLVVRPSGGHRLITGSVEQGNLKHWVIPGGWLGIELEIEDWTA